MKVVYDWLKEYVGEEMPTKENLEELLTFHAFEVDGIERVGKHDVIDVKVLPDRSSDCLSHRGIAREISTLIGRPLVHDPLQIEVTLEPKTPQLRVVIHDSENCRRFTGALITGVEVTASPEWLKERLEALGQRSINNVVDATNYVMLALGQPLHAYDADLFPHDASGWDFGVRMARDGETVTTLSNETYTLSPAVQLIVEGKSDIPVGVAGIKGGKSAEIKESTKTIILEAANFNPSVTRRATQFLQLQTDASKRFENDLSPELASYGLSECVALILKIAGGNCEGYTDVYPTPILYPAVAVQLPHINGLLGLNLNEQEVTDILLKKLRYKCSYGDITWWVLPPFERTDIRIAEDIIAEIGRIHGYEHSTPVTPTAVPLTEINARHYYSEKIRDILISLGASEVVTSSFRKEDSITLQNALASDKGCLRSVLGENIREVLDRNIPNKDLLGVDAIEVFEIGTVFEKTTDGSDVTEHMALGIGVRIKQQYSPKDDARITELVSALEAGLGVPLGGIIKDGIYECNLSSILGHLPTPAAYDPYIGEGEIVFTPYSSFPFIARDIALWSNESTTSGEIESIIREHSGSLLLKLALFDEFKKDGKVSYAFRLIFQSFERTLTDDEINVIIETLYTVLRGKGFEIR